MTNDHYDVIVLGAGAPGEHSTTLLRPGEVLAAARTVPGAARP